MEAHGETLSQQEDKKPNKEVADLVRVKDMVVEKDRQADDKAVNNKIK